MKGQREAKPQHPAARSPDKKKKSKKKSRADKLAAVAAAVVPRQGDIVDYEPSEADVDGGAEGEATDEAEHGEAGAGEDHADGDGAGEAEEEEAGEPEPDSDDAKSDISMEEQRDIAILGGDASKLSKGLLTEMAQRMAARCASHRHTVHELRAVNKHAIRTLLGEVKPPRRQLTAVRQNRRPAGRPNNNNPRTKYGSPAQVSTYTNAKGAPVTRNHHLRSYCHVRKLCLGCYGTGHLVANCTEPVKGGAPEGYMPPNGNKR
jgi:hypothetical protein